MTRFFLYDLIKKINYDSAPIILQGTGKQERDYLHVSDVAKGLELIMTKGNSGEIYNICSGKPTSLGRLCNHVLRILKREEIEIVWNNKKDTGTRDNWYGDNTKIKKIGFMKTEGDNLLNDTIIKLNSYLKV